ncbi:MAG: 30S ribosomal protein S14 [Alphaproteobacteria bacterium]
MAKVSLVNRNKKREKLVKQYANKRASLKKQLKNKELDFEERVALQKKLDELPNNSAPARVRLRCGITGRPRGNYKKFGICRIKLRELGSSGLVPGLKKASW